MCWYFNDGWRRQNIEIAYAKWTTMGHTRNKSHIYLKIFYISLGFCGSWLRLFATLALFSSCPSFCISLPLMFSCARFISLSLQETLSLQLWSIKSYCRTILVEALLLRQPFFSLLYPTLVTQWIIKLNCCNAFFLVLFYGIPLHTFRRFVELNRFFQRFLQCEFSNSRFFFFLSFGFVFRLCYVLYVPHLFHMIFFGYVSPLQTEFRSLMFQKKRTMRKNAASVWQMKKTRKKE